MLMRVPMSDRPERRRVIQRPTPFLLDDTFGRGALAKRPYQQVPLPVLANGAIVIVKLQAMQGTGENLIPMSGFRRGRQVVGRKIDV